MGNITSKKLAFIFSISTCIIGSIALADDENNGFNLADAFAQTDEKQTEKIIEVTEVEPIVVGRKKWNEKPAQASPAEQNSQPTPEDPTPSRYKNWILSKPNKISLGESI